MKPKTATASQVHVTASAANHWRVYEKEIATYLRELPRLLSEGKQGQYALIKDDAILGVWVDQGDAIEEGHRRFGLGPICVKAIDPRDPERFALLKTVIADIPA